jgi:hypothetical protein
MNDIEKQIKYWEDILNIYNANMFTIHQAIIRNYDCEVGTYPKYTVVSDDYLDTNKKINTVKLFIKGLKNQLNKNYK